MHHRLAPKVQTRTRDQWSKCQYLWKNFGCYLCIWFLLQDLCLLHYLCPGSLVPSSDSSPRELRPKTEDHHRQCQRFKVFLKIKDENQDGAKDEDETEVHGGGNDHGDPKVQGYGNDHGNLKVQGDGNDHGDPKVQGDGNDHGDPKVQEDGDDRGDPEGLKSLASNL
jgi:hypothetical protein